jgi:drug/metabolite transporter (DMT)-like permease
MIGPIATIALGTWILEEPFTVWHAVGTALVIAGVALLSMKKEAKEGAMT